MPNIIKTMQLLNYSPDMSGVCFGISAMAAQASLRKGHEVFANRICRIQNYSEAQIETIKSEGKHLDKKLELCCFFDGLSIYQGSTSVNTNFLSIVSKNQNFSDTPRIMESKMFEGDDEFIYPEVIANLVNAFTFEEFLSFIQEIKEHFGQQAFSIMLRHSPINHTTHIGFDGKKWLSTNNDSVILGEDNFESIKKIANNVFLLRRDEKADQMPVLMNILQPKGSKTDLKALAIHDFSLDKITDTFNKKTLSYLISSYVRAARYDSVLEIFNKIKLLKLTEAEKIELIESKRLNGTTLLHWLANSGELHFFEQMINVMDELGLSSESKISILAKKDNSGLSALFYAIKNKHENLVKLILNACPSNIAEEIKFDFLSAQNNDGISALFFAAHTGHTDIVRHLLSTISSITNEQTQFKLLNEKNIGTPTLFVAALKKHEDITYLLLNAILSIQDEKARYELFSSKHKNAIPVLFQTVSDNQNNITESLIKVYSFIEDKNLRAGLLSAKDEHNMTALFKAVTNGNEKILTMLLEAILSIKDTAIQLKLLNTKYNDKSPLYVAARDENESMVKLLLAAILSVKDKKAQIELLSAKFHDKSALYIAARYGYENIVELLLEAIDLIEDKESRTDLLMALDDYDCSAASIAKANEHKKVARLLNKAIKEETQKCVNCMIL